MGRGTLTFRLIPDQKSRRTTLERRKKGLMKKAEQFSTLCGVDTCIIIYGSVRSAQPEIWPPDEREVRRILQRCRNEGVSRTKRVSGPHDFFLSRKKQLEADLTKLKIANWKAKYSVDINLSEEQRHMLKITLGGKIDRMKRKRSLMKAGGTAEPPSDDCLQFEYALSGSKINYPGALNSVPISVVDQVASTADMGNLHDYHSTASFFFACTEYMQPSELFAYGGDNASFQNSNSGPWPPQSFQQFASSEGALPLESFAYGNNDASFQNPNFESYPLQNFQQFVSPEAALLSESFACSNNNASFRNSTSGPCPLQNFQQFASPEGV